MSWDALGLGVWGGGSGWIAVGGLIGQNWILPISFEKLWGRGRGALDLCCGVGIVGDCGDFGAV